MDHQYRENDARNMCSNYNQTRAYVECSPNQLKNYTLSTFPPSNRRNFEDSGKVLSPSVSEINQSIVVQLYQPTLMRWLSLLCVYKSTFLLYVTCCPSACVAKVISWHAFVSHLGMFFENRMISFQ